ncbi:SH3 domain-containing protein [uncultured Bacteroides sp.]|uniref:SH3 domain-containing protein n=1 Tax=uncultured Bacteroides sp. TaxID=162156 RepID=UPI0025EC3452|nr:SH3 domain-containing protein [uncultured Bacteroides sp.]
MSKNNDWFSSLQRSNEVMKRLCGATTALSQLAESAAWIKINRLDQNLFAAADSATAAISRMDNWYKTTSFDAQAHTLSLLGESLSAGYMAATKFAATPTVLDGLRKIEQAISITPSGAFSAMDQMTKALRMYQTPDIIQHINSVLSNLPSFDSAILETAKSLDLSDIEIHDDGAIIYDGVRYDSERIATVLDTQIEVAKKPTVREQFEALKQRLWLLLLILNIIMFLPQVPETVEFYCDAVAQMQDILEEKSRICFTIKERSILREEASSTAARIRYLPYDTPLEIISDIPRWYQVTYTDENGAEITGWISKISVELEG